MQIAGIPITRATTASKIATTMTAATTDPGGHGKDDGSSTTAHGLATMARQSPGRFVWG